MSRPALSASRGAQVVNLLAAFPERRFSLTEIARATGINGASCHAVLGELERCGYLSRHGAQKAYSLGPVLLAVGAAAIAANPLLARARTVAAELRGEVGVPVLLSTVAGEEIVCVLSLEDGSGRTAGLRAGERVPLVPPIGASFVAWAAPEAADAWIAGRAADAACLRETLALTRERGFHVTLRSPAGGDITSVLAELAAAGGTAPDPRARLARFVDALDVRAPPPDALDAEEAHDVHLIAAPVFDRETGATYNLCLGGFPAPLAGTEIAALGRRLVAACLRVMR